jgi:hypothetical protein
MAMEHRYFERLSIPVQVSIRYKNHTIDHLTAYNCSFGGMFLDAKIIGICCNDIVTLDVSMEGEDFPMQGLVVHVSDDGIGLMLLELNINYYNRLLGQLGSALYKQLA